MRRRRKKQQQRPKRQELRVEELKAILDRAKGALEPEDFQKLGAAIDTLAFLTSELEAKGASIARLRRWLFGAATEKTSRVTGEGKSGPAGASGTATPPSGEPKEKRKGHGRNGAPAYLGADKVKVPHGSIHDGDRCPLREKGKVYRQTEPAVLVRIKGMAPLRATVQEKERLRCNAWRSSPPTRPRASARRSTTRRRRA